MKVTYYEEIENRTAFSRKMYCPHCGSHIYNIVHQLMPEPHSWWIRCDECGYESEERPAREIAIQDWKNVINVQRA